MKVFSERAAQKSSAEEAAATYSNRLPPSITNGKGPKKVNSAPPEDDQTQRGRLLRDLKDTIALLEAKVGKMELQVKLKEEKIRFLSKKLESDLDE